MGWQLYHCPISQMIWSIWICSSPSQFFLSLSCILLVPLFFCLHCLCTISLLFSLRYIIQVLQWAFPNFPNSPLLLSISSLVLESLLPTFWPLKAKISVELKAPECSLWNIFFTISTALPFSTNFSMVLWEGSSKQTVWCSIIDSCENSWCLNLVNLGNIWLALKEMTSYRKKGFNPFGTTKSFWDHFRYVF